MNDMTQAFILLLAGFVVVFVVLILLIVIVTLYGKIITSIQNRGKKKKNKNKTMTEEPSRPEPAAVVTKAEEAEIDDDGAIPDEIIAVIAAAVDAVCGEKPHRVKSVRKSRNTRSAWSRAGVLDNTRPF